MANPERGAPPLLLPEAKYFTVSVPFTPADLEASLNALACHHSQMSPEAVQRIRAGSARVWNGKVAFVPASLATKGDDLFR